MFGYVTINRDALSDAEFKRYREYYCGLCHELCALYGSPSRITLSNDLTFLYILLASLYEPEEKRVVERCPMHPLKRHACLLSEPARYAADMNIAMTYHKCVDNWRDDKNLASRGEMRLLQRAYDQVRARYPEKCAFVAARIDELSAMEAQNVQEIDGPANCTGRLFGEMYAYGSDMWTDTLRVMGEAMGRFIYLMDAYDDLPADKRLKRYNPLFSIANRPDYEDFMQRLLTMTIAEATGEFEKLPLVKDINLLRNVLYSGVWSKYALIQKRRNKESGDSAPKGTSR